MSTETKPKKPRAKKTKDSPTPIATLPIETPSPLSEQLTLDYIITDDEKYNELVKVTFDNGKYTEIYRYFRPTDIETMLEDFSNFMVDYEKTGRVIKDKDVENYISLHIIQHFSTLVEKFPEDIYEKLDIFKKMLNNELVEKLFESFDENEIAKVYETMYKKIEGYQKLAKQDENLKKQLRDKIKDMNLENKEIIEEIMFGDEDDGSERIQ